MHSFKDTQGREWNIVVNVGTAKRVRDRIGVDVLKLYAEEASKVFGDIVLLVDTIFVMVEPQAKDRGVSDVDFAATLVGNVLDTAASALMEEVADFFPDAKRELLRKIKAKGETASSQIMAAATHFVETFDPTSGNSFTSVPALSA